MSFVTTQEDVTYLSGPGGLTLVSGTYLSAGGGTGGIVIPGYTNASGTLTAITPDAPGLNVGAGCRNIHAYWFTPTSNDATAPGAAKSYDSTTYDRDIITMVTTADTGGRYFMLCSDVGQ